jgi:hypothetical protein
VSPRSKRKRDEVKDSGSSKPTEPAVEKTTPEEEVAFNPYDDAGSVSSLASSPPLLVPLSLLLFLYSHTHFSMLIAATKRKKKKPRFMEWLLRVSPKLWFFLQIAVLPRNPRLPLNRTWKPRLL